MHAALLRQLKADASAPGSVTCFLTKRIGLNTCHSSRFHLTRSIQHQTPGSSHAASRQTQALQSAPPTIGFPPKGAQAGDAAVRVHGQLQVRHGPRAGHLALGRLEEVLPGVWVAWECAHPRSKAGARYGGHISCPHVSTHARTCRARAWCGAGGRATPLGPVVSSAKSMKQSVSFKRVAQNRVLLSQPAPDRTCVSISSLDPMSAGRSAPSTMQLSGKLPLKCFVSTSSFC